MTVRDALSLIKKENEFGSSNPIEVFENVVTYSRLTIQNEYCVVRVVDTMDLELLDHFYNFGSKMPSANFLNILATYIIRPKIFFNSQMVGSLVGSWKKRDDLLKEQFIWISAIPSRNWKEQIRRHIILDNLASLKAQRNLLILISEIDQFTEGSIKHTKELDDVLNLVSLQLKTYSADGMLPDDTKEPRYNQATLQEKVEYIFFINEQLKRIYYMIVK